MFIWKHLGIEKINAGCFCDFIYSADSSWSGAPSVECGVFYGEDSGKASGDKVFGQAAWHCVWFSGGGIVSLDGVHLCDDDGSWCD